jgi:hypothetical protein
MTERDRRTLRKLVSKNHTTTAAQMTTELNIHLEDFVSTKTIRREHRSNTHGRASIAKPLITESNGGVTTIKPGHQTTGKTCVMWSDELSFTLPYISKSLRLENTQRSLQSGMPGSNSETRGGFCDDFGSSIVVQYSFGLISTLRGRITARELCGQVG